MILSFEGMRSKTDATKANFAEYASLANSEKEDGHNPFTAIAVSPSSL